MKIKPWHIVVLFVLALFYLFAREVKADVSVELGKTNISGSWAGEALLIHERFGKYDVGMGLIGRQEFDASCGYNIPRYPKCQFDVRPNMFIHAQRIVPYKKCFMGIGPAWFQNTSRISNRLFQWSLMIGCSVSDKISVRIRHFSNAGSGSPNLGQDMITIGWRF
jgi:hypothetical protein